MIIECLLSMAVVCGGVEFPILAQQQSAKPRISPRDNTRPENTSTSVIRGRVTNTEGNPLRRVQLRLSGETLDSPRMASTDTQGHFEIRDLPAGRYMLIATRAGYLRTTYGALYPGEPGQPIEVLEGTIVDNVDLTLPHSGVIAGTVYDEAGEPDAGVMVVSLQMRFLNGKRHVVPVTRAVSDDVGEYRLSGLQPGEYYVEAVSNEQWESEAPEKKMMMGFLPTFYPSAANVGEAQHVKLRVGQQMSGLDVSLIPGKLVSISGTATNAQGMPLAGDTVSLTTVMHGEGFSSFSNAGSTKVGPDGRFVIRNVSPGVYTVAVMSDPDAGTPESAQTSVAASTDVNGVQLTTTAASTVSGRIVLNAESKLPPSFPFTRFMVLGSLVDDTGHVNMTAAPPHAGGKVRDDGSFTVENVSGQMRFTVSPLPPGWAVKRVDYNGEDILAKGVDPHGQSLDGLLVTLTDEFPTVNGTVRDDKGNASPTSAVIIFPEDPSLWDSGLNQVRIARVDKNGSFSLRALRPGSYLIVAVSSLGANAWMDPDVLESLRSRSLAIVLSEGDTKQLDLVVVNAATQ